MKRCAGCGKRIWSSALSIPERGDYHFECAKLAGVLPKEMEEVYEKAKDLPRRAMQGEDIESLVLEMKNLEAQAKTGRKQAK